MKFSILSGAYKNAGDFLIVQRCKELLSFLYPGCEMEEFERRKELSDSLEKINESDALIFAGGPAYSARIYPDTIPLVADLSCIRVPLFAMALGWSDRLGKGDLYRYSFTESTLRLLRRMESDGFPLGCRDSYSVFLLRRAGIGNAKMTGCAAWYYLPEVGATKLKSGSIVRKICISDPADAANMESAFALALHLRERFSGAKLVFVFHRGISADVNTAKAVGAALGGLVRRLEREKIEYADISYGEVGFSVYDDCDLHIGFRVHAHIYNLSRRRASLLIEEDSRGEGVNEALGLYSIKALDLRIYSLANRYIRKAAALAGLGTNPFLLREVDDWLDRFETMGGVEFEWAFERMQYYFEQMCEHLRLIGESL